MVCVDGWAWSAKHYKYTPIEQIVLYALLDRKPWTGIEFVAQAQIGRYTADFVVTLFNEKQPIIVECDGHDFHEKTKEQAQHDKKRDREMQALGYRVYRFTGSEIWKTRGRCVTESMGLN